MKILVVEDDLVIGKSLHKGLVETGLACTWVRDGVCGLEQVLTGQYDGVVLDLLLPGQPGLEVLRQVRGSKLGCPGITRSRVACDPEPCVASGQALPSLTGSRHPRCCGPS